MPDYLRKRSSGAFYYQRRVPKDLRHRRDVFKSQFIEEYLGTSDKAVAKRRVSRTNEEWEQKFDAMRRDEKITAAQVERIRLATQFQVHGAMIVDPLDGPDRVDADLDALLPNVEADARKYLGRAGLDCSERNLDAAMRAVFVGTLGAKALFEHGLEPPPVPAFDPLCLNSVPGGPTVTEAAAAYGNADDVTATEKTRRQLKQTARLFGDHVGDKKPIATVTGKDAVAFLDRLSKINPEYRRDPKAGELTLAELEESYPAKDGKGLSAATINRHAMHLRVLINWLIDRHELPEEHRNPFAGKSRKVKNKTADSGEGGSYLPMSDTEIAALLDGALLAREFGKNFQACVGWLIALGAYTGARASELCRITKEDVRVKDGIPYVAIRGTKTENAPRVVPLHADLIKAGLLDYVATCKGPLFGISGKALSTRFTAYRRSCGVDRPGVVFHSLRKSFVSCLEEAEVPSDTIALLEGHKAKRSFTLTVYNPHGPTLKKLAESVAKIRYDAVKLSEHSR